MVDVVDLFLEDIFVTLRDVGNHEINQNDEQENDDDNPEYPDEEDHESGLEWVILNNSINLFFGRISNLDP